MVNPADPDAVARTLLGLATPDQPARSESAPPVSQSIVDSWCRAIGETNPLYLDREYALGHGLRDTVAPSPLLQTWTMPERHTDTLHARVRETAAELGFDAVVATDYDQRYLAPVHPGDRLTDRAWVESVTPLKRTRLGEGHFVTIAFDFLRDGRTVGTQRARTFYFRPRESQGAEPPRRPPEPPPPDAVELKPSTVPLSATLISAAATASRDHEAVHHDPAVARRQGLPDIICSIVTTAGLVTRYVLDQLGHRTTLRRLRLRLAAPAYPHDVLTHTGHMRRPAPEQTATVVVRGDHDRGRHVTATLDTITDRPVTPV